MANEVADKVVESFLVQLAKTLDPQTISTRLLAAGIIDEHTWEEATAKDAAADFDRNLGVMKAVRKRVRADSAYFHRFCDELEHENYTKTLAKNMRDELQKQTTCKESATTLKDEKPQQRDNSASEPRQCDNSASEPRQCVNSASEQPAKRRKVLREGKIKNESLLMDIANEILDKYEEVGVYLGLSSKVMKKELSTENGLSAKAFHMLLLGKERMVDDFTYAALAHALEDAGLNSCAMKYCYITDLDKPED